MEKQLLVRRMLFYFLLVKYSLKTNKPHPLPPPTAPETIYNLYCIPGL